MKLSQKRINKAIDQNIRTRRLAAGYSLEGFIKKSKLGFTKAAMCNLEAGRQNINIYQLFLIAAALDIRLFDLLEGTI